MEAPLLWFTNLRIWCNLRTKTTEHDFQSDYLIRIWNIRGYIKGQESRNLNIRYSFTQCNNICLLLYMICDIRFNNSTSETRHSDKCESYRWTFVEFYIWQKTREWILVWCAGGDRCIDGHISSDDNEISARQKCSSIYIFHVHHYVGTQKVYISC